MILGASSRCSDADRTPTLINLALGLLHRQQGGNAKAKRRKGKAKPKIGGIGNQRFTSAVIVATYPCSTDGGDLHIAAASFAGSKELPKEDLRTLARRLRQIADEIEGRIDAPSTPDILA